MNVYGQGVSFTAQAPRQVMLGQRFYLNYTLNTHGSGFIGPEIAHFDILDGPSMQSGSQVQIINGSYSRSVYDSYIFILQANEPGTFSIGPATISAGGKKYSSNSLTITVIGQKSTAPQAGNQTQQRQAKGMNPVSDPGNDIFLKATVNKSNPYVGEMVIATYLLYTPTSNLRTSKIPPGTNDGFWTENLLPENQNWKQYNEVYNGKNYIVVELGKLALFPQKTGQLTIKPVEQLVEYQYKIKSRNPFADDPFFSDIFENSGFADDFQVAQKTLKSNSVNINVKPLPLNGKPIDFTGATGNLTLTTELASTTAKTNEALTFKVTISGNGNLSLIEKPSINLPPDFEVYDPKTIDNIHTGINGISGSRTFEYLIIPRTVGTFSIPPVLFSYFDPGKGSYVNLSSAIPQINVVRGSGSADDAIAGRDIQQMNKDIRFINEKSETFSNKGASFFGTPLYWFLLILPVILFAVFIYIRRKQVKSRSDLAQLKQKRATKYASSRLKKAKSLMEKQNEEAFYEEISAALWGYVGNKFNIPLAELSTETARTSLEQKNIDSKLVERYLEVLHLCEYARFAPGTVSENMMHVYENAFNAITETESQLK